MMKRVLSVFLVLAMLLGLGACAQPSAPAPTEKSPAQTQEPAPQQTARRFIPGT